MTRLLHPASSLLLAVMLLGPGARAWAAVKFYVSPAGNDKWSGRRPSVNWIRTDGPFATIQRALDAARVSRAAGPKTVFVRGGVYELREPLAVRPADSGVTLAAYEQERPVISGGVRIDGWREQTIEGRAVWTAELPARLKGAVFRELWVNGKRATRARQPNQGYLEVQVPEKPAGEWNKGQAEFRFKAGDIKSWGDITEGEVVVMSRWVESRLPIQSVDEKERVIRFDRKSVYQLQDRDPYYLEGARDFLDAPGEWYLDRKTGTVSYLPREGEQIAQAEAVAPLLAQLVLLEGSDPKERVTGVTFRNLTFSYAEWCFPATGATAGRAGKDAPQPSGFGQAAVGVPAAVSAVGLCLSGFEDCRFEHLGTYGLELGRGCLNNRVSRCEFSDLGAGGIKIGTTSIPKESADCTSANEVSDCAISDGGKLFHSAVGIWVGQSPGNRMVHNEVHDFYYTGLSIGWTWGYGPAAASNNIVEFNLVHHIGARSDGDGPILSDMGGIYTLGMQPGTCILNNVWHDIAGLRYGGWGIYLDEGSSSIRVERNVVYRTTHGGFHQHYGATNILRNNIFAFGRDQQLQRTRSEPHVSFFFQTNLVYFDSGVLLGGDWSNDRFVMDSNLYFDSRPDVTEENFRLGPTSWAQWRGRGHDTNSILADPRFVAPRQGDFTLASGSPAPKTGFVPIRTETVGIRKTTLNPP